METEFKWLMIAFAVVMASISVGDAVKEHQVNQCRIEAIQAGFTTEAINTICKK